MVDNELDGIYKETVLMEDNESVDARIILKWYYKEMGDRGSTVVKVLCYKSEGRWFDPSWYHWNLSLT